MYPRAQLAYCDYIAEQCRQGILNENPAQDLVKDCSFVKFDLHPTEGYMLSTTKMLTVTDKYGKMYKVTVEEL